VSDTQPRTQLHAACCTRLKEESNRRQQVASRLPTHSTPHTRGSGLDARVGVPTPRRSVGLRRPPTETSANGAFDPKVFISLVYSCDAHLAVCLFMQSPPQSWAA
jgi:hypothetical protein